MKVEIAYGKTQQYLKVNPDTTAVFSLTSEKQAAPLEELVDNAVLKPTGSAALTDFLKNCQQLLVVVNDSARGIPTAPLLKHLKTYWEHLQVKYIVATGAHRGSTESELQKIFGTIYNSDRESIFIHAAEKAEMLDLGTTSLGTPVKYNRIISQCDKIINLNSVEPHYFAGYTGGRKSFMPGLAAYEAIERNHSLAMLPSSGLLQLEQNPVHNDMEAAVELIQKEIFSLNTVLNSNNEIIHISAGNWKTSFYKAVKQAETIFLRSCPLPADIVIAVVKSPLDEDLYQAQKGIENCRNILRKNGIIILVAACPGGIGKDQFYQLLSSCQTPEEVFARINRSYKLGYHKAAKLADLMKEHQLWMVTGMDASVLAKINIRKFSAAQSALQEAIAQKGNAARIIINQDAGLVVPVIE